MLGSYDGFNHIFNSLLNRTKSSKQKAATHLYLVKWTF